MKRLTILSAVLLGASLIAMPGAQANTATCTASDGPTTYTVTVATGVSCFGTGPASDLTSGVPPLLAGWTLLDKTDAASAVAGFVITATNLVPGTGTLSGTFNFTYATGYSNFVVAFRDGNNNGFAAFSLTGSPPSADFTMTRDSLSHADLFGKVSAVPVPIVGAGLPGLLGACGALLALARRRRQKNA